MAPEHVTATLAARAHTADGSRRGDTVAVAQLGAAARAAEDELPDAFALPFELTENGTLLLQLTSPTHALDIMLLVSDAARPIATTFSLAIPATETGWDRVPENASTERGAPAPSTAARTGPHRASPETGDMAPDAIECIDETDPKGARVVVATPKRDHVLSALMDLVLDAYESMTARQRQIVRLVKIAGQQQRVATHLGVSRQAVNQSLGAARWPHLRTAERAVRRRLGLVANGQW